MTQKELRERLAAMTVTQMEQGWRMIKEGYSARGIMLNSTLTLKQANALFAWRSRYWRIKPTYLANGP
jgi:hypothetical protein